MDKILREMIVVRFILTQIKREVPPTVDFN